MIYADPCFQTSEWDATKLVQSSACTPSFSPGKEVPVKIEEFTLIRFWGPFAPIAPYRIGRTTKHLCE
jgi:hypothetical protein